MRASRLLSILMLLQTRGRLSAPQLAAELEVSQRTVLRDMDQLSAAGVPVWSDRGRDGGFQLREGWSTTLTGMTEGEAQALFLAGLPNAATELGLGSAAASARLKMLAALPMALREDAARASARLHVDPVDWYCAATPPIYLQAVANAVWQQRLVHIRYESWRNVIDRFIKPLGLVLKAGIWYVVALADSAKAPRTYRLSNIQSLSIQEKTFIYPKMFHLATHWQTATKRFETEIYTDSARLRVTAHGMKRIKELSAAVAAAAIRTAANDDADRDWFLITVPIESIEHATDQFLSIGADAEVLEPLALRKRIQNMLAAMVALYKN